MAPKKNANVSITTKPTGADGNPVKVTKKRPPASRVTKAKPPLKTPSVVKIKIKKPRKKEPEEATIGETVKPDKPIQYERHLQPDHLIELANQVARFQLGKSKLSPQQVAVPEEPVAVAPVKKGRAKKVKKMEEIAVDTEVAPPAPKSKKKMPPAKAKSPKPPPKPRVRKPKATEPKKAQPENVKPKPTKSRAKPKCKKKLDPTSHEVQLCPDILNELKSFEVSTTPKTSSRTNTSRSSSVTSAAPSDRFSWVKEISSSSTTTPTKELVCINGKFPEIKLVDYRKSGRRQYKRILDDIDSISGSSKTSESSTKRRKVARNAFSMSQKKFRLSLRKKNNSWTVNKTPEEKRLNGTKSPIRIPNDSTAANNNIEKHSSSSSEISARSNIDLSSSSSSSTSQSTNVTTNSVLNKTNNATDSVPNKPNIQAQENIQDIRQKLDSLDLEFINWVGAVDKELNLNKLSSISSDILRLEREAIKECQHFKIRLSNCSSERSSERNATKTNSEVLADEDLPDITQSISHDIDNNNDNNNNSNIPEHNENHINTLNRDDILAKPLPPTESTDNSRRKSCGETNYNNDDEDALSLFAESITGIDSSKYSTVGSYKPARSPQCSPVSEDDDINIPDFTEEYSYFKFSSGSDHSSPHIVNERHETVVRKEITNNAFKSSERPKLVTCVKKIADSTSVQKDDFAVPNNFSVPKVDDSRNLSKSTLMQATCVSTPAVKSQVFRGVCFFNLISKCCKNLCTFPHQRIPTDEIQKRLQRLHETSFICEYMLVRKYPQLRKNYITTFVDECSRRDLTPILLEMVIDSYREEVNIRTHALETALLNISNKNLNDYVFFLNLEPDLLGQKVCEVLMKAIADTQNFTRFKQVFVKLTDFMVDLSQTFVLDVAGRILERICILPYEESLASAILKIIQHTSVDIFKHPSMDIFETRLRELNITIFKRLEDYKKSVVRLEPVLPKVTSAKIVGSMNGHGPVLDKPREAETRRYTSPDTTHFDTNQILVPVPPKINQNPKPKFEFANLPRITRTIDISNSNKAKTYMVKTPQTITAGEEAVPQRAPKEAVPQRAPKPLMRPPFQQSLLRPSYLNASVNVKAAPSFERELVNTKFSLLSKRFGARDAPFCYRREEELLKFKMASNKDELLAVIEDKALSLNKTYVNLKKTSKQRLTKGYIETKLESVKRDWDIIQDAHTSLVKCVPREQKKTLSYFEKDLYVEYEEIYVSLHSDLNDLHCVTLT